MEIIALMRRPHTTLLAALVLFIGLDVTGPRISVAGLAEAATPQQTLIKLDQALRQRPMDVGLRFQRSHALTQLNRIDQATKILEQLIEEQPNQAEFYNNLALLYTRKGDYQKAADTLNRGLQTNPVYAALHENLGDVYAHMASQAYHNALKKTGEKSSVPSPNLVALNDLAAPSVQPIVIEAKVVEPEVVDAVVVAKPAQSIEAPIATVPKTIPEDTSKVSPTVRPLQNEEAQVRATISDWLTAWSAQNVSDYIAAYSQRFVPPRGMSRPSWEKQRHQRLTKPNFIQVSFTQARFEVLSATYARVRFLQRYASDRYSDSGEKVLELSHENGEWKILSERSG